MNHLSSISVRVSGKEQSLIDHTSAREGVTANACTQHTHTLKTYPEGFHAACERRGKKAYVQMLTHTKPKKKCSPGCHECLGAGSASNSHHSGLHLEQYGRVLCDASNVRRLTLTEPPPQQAGINESKRSADAYPAFKEESPPPTCFSSELP